jgi:exportin-2 (importin alpha re-exporter)
MADLPSLLLASLNPDTRKQAEQNLTVLSLHQGFLIHLLSLILEPSQDRSVRLSGSVYLKNITKLRWEEVILMPCYPSFLALIRSMQDIQPLAQEDKAALRAQLVPAMLALSAPADKAIRAQVAESVALIAELDFPSKWDNLIDVRWLLLLSRR